MTMKKLDPWANLNLESWAKDILYENNTRIELDEATQVVTMDLEDFLSLLRVVRKSKGEAAKLRVVSRNAITKLEELVANLDEFVR